MQPHSQKKFEKDVSTKSSTEAPEKFKNLAEQPVQESQFGKSRIQKSTEAKGDMPEVPSTEMIKEGKGVNLIESNEPSQKIQEKLGKRESGVESTKLRESNEEPKTEIKLS
jgi:hypothetical protein